MAVTLRSFLNQHRSIKKYTHTSMSGGKWRINNNELDTFYTLYAKE
jgi:hypothetical protein